MRMFLPLFAIAAFAACSSKDAASSPAARAERAALVTEAQAMAAAPSAAGDARHPVVIELFQSQGCSSCPPANADLNAVAGRPDILALSFAVTYWDQLGWKDGFAKPAYTARQWDYANAAGRDRVYTPQIIFNGRDMMLGGERKHFDRLIATSGPLGSGPPIDAMGNTLVIGPGKAAAPATAWLVRYDPRVRSVAIKAGENGGRTLPHRDIVTELVALGQWHGQEVHFAMTANHDPALRTAILLQQGKGGPLVAARKL